MATILTKKSDTASAVPVAGDLTNSSGGAELAVNTADKRLFAKNSGGTVVEIGTNPTVIQVDNININGNAITSTDTNGNIDLTPNGTGEVNITKVDIDSGAIDGTAIGGSTPAAGTFTTLASTGNTTLGDASGDSVTINAATVSTPNGLNFDSNTFVIDAANNRVGVGTSSPGARLDVRTTSSAPLIRVTTNADGAGSAQGGLEWFETNSSAVTASITGIRGGSSFNQTNLIFSTADSGANTERLRINSSGNVGIGTSSPAQRLHVSTSSSIIGLLESTGSGAARLYFKNTGMTTAGDTQIWSQNNDLVLNTAANERMRIDSSGNVGIGTSSPAFKLHVGGTGSQFALISTTDTTSTTGVLFGDSASNAVGRIEYVHSDNGMRFFTNGTTQATLDSSGNLGLGVTPSAWASTAMQVGGYAAVTTNTSLGSAEFTSNAYRSSGSTWNYINSNYASRYRQYDGAHSWFTAPSGTAGNAITFTQALTLNTNGALVLQGGDTNANGTGITFPATQSASSNANTLDDYEEGTWTPTFGNLTIGNGSVWGFYIKVGRLVTLRFGFNFGSTSSFSGSITSIGGLPFPIDTSSNSQSTAVVGLLKQGVGWYTGSVTGTGSSLQHLSVSGGASIVGATNPFTWAADDYASINMTYNTTA